MKSKSRIALLTIGLLLIATTLSAHDLFLRLDSFFVRPESVVVIKVLNGTFSKSENAITRDRLRDISVVGPRHGEIPRRRHAIVPRLRIKVGDAHVRNSVN